MYGGVGGGWRTSKVALSISVIIFNNKKRKKESRRRQTAHASSARYWRTLVCSAPRKSPFLFISTVRPRVLERLRPLPAFLVPSLPFPQTTSLLHMSLNIFLFITHHSVVHAKIAYKRSANNYLAFIYSIWMGAVENTYFQPVFLLFVNYYHYLF